MTTPNPESLRCPACEDATLAPAERDGHACHACDRCGGLWLEWSTFGKLEQEFTSARPTRAGAARELPPLGSPIPEGRLYRHCPRCTQQMSRRRYQRVSRVIVDTCFGHGVWLDRHELEHVVAFLEAGGLEKSRQHEESAALEQRAQQRVVSKLLHDMRWRRLAR